MSEKKYEEMVGKKEIGSRRRNKQQNFMDRVAPKAHKNQVLLSFFFCFEAFFFIVRNENKICIFRNKNGKKNEGEKKN